MLKKLLFITIVMLFTTVLVKGQPASLKFKTVEASDFVAQPDNDENGFGYRIRYLYPSDFSDKAVLAKLQYGLNKIMLEEENAQLHPEQALNEQIKKFKKDYFAEIDEYPDVFIISLYDTVYFVNHELVQFLILQEIEIEDFEQSEVEMILFNLRTGDVYSRDDIFKPEKESQISKLLIAAIHHQLGIEDSRLTANDVWPEDIRFIVLESGIIFYYKEGIEDYELKDPSFLFPYEQMLPYLRTGTGVWNLANGN